LAGFFGLLPEHAGSDRKAGYLINIAVPLDGEEREALELSAQKIKEVIESISSIEDMEGTIPSY
jgi:hypothetical protein